MDKEFKKIVVLPEIRTDKNKEEKEKMKSEKKLEDLEPEEEILEEDIKSEAEVLVEKKEIDASFIQGYNFAIELLELQEKINKISQEMKKYNEKL